MDETTVDKMDPMSVLGRRLQMKRKYGTKVVSLLLSALLLLGLMPDTAYAAQENAFILVAEAEGKLLIEPEYVTYTDGQTIKSALADSGHTFTGLNEGWITAIDNVTGNYTRSDENGKADLSLPASEIQYYRFSENTNSQPSKGLQSLMEAMADYQLEESDVKKAAKTQYDNAVSAFVRINNNSESAAALAKELEDAVQNYKDTLLGATYQVTFKDGQTVCTGAEIIMENDYGKIWTDDGDGILQIPAGIYTFSVSKDGLGATGKIAVTADMMVSLAIPKDEWLNKETFRLSGSYNANNTEDGTFEDGEFTLGVWDGRQLTVPVKDTFTGTVYSYAEYQNLSSRPELKAYYTSADTGTDLEAELIFGSYTNGAGRVLNSGARGNTVLYRFSSAGTDGYTYTQDYTVNFDRIPSLASIRVSDQEGTDQAAMELFDGDKTGYTYKVLDTVTSVNVKATPLVSGYEVTVNGEKDTGDGVMVALNQEDSASAKTDITIVVSSGDYQNTYTLTVLPGAGQQITFKVLSEDTTLKVVNKNGLVMPCKKQNKNLYLYTLVAEDTYYYLASRDTYYYAKDEFTLSDLTNQTVEVSVPKEDWLKELALGSGKTVSKKGNLALIPEFSPGEHVYKTKYVDTEHLAYVWVTATTGATDSIKAIYTQNFASDLYHGKEYTITLVSEDKIGTQLKRFLMDENPIENTATIRLTKEIDGVTYYQDYIIEFKRTLTLKDMSARCNDSTATLIQEDGITKGFTPDVKEYTVTVPLAARELELSVSAYTDNRAYGESNVGYRVYVDGEDVTASGKKSVELDGTIQTQDVTITVKNAKAPDGSTDYTLHILKSPPVTVDFALSPSNAQLAVYEVLSGERLWPEEDGTYQLCEGFQYNYVTTAYGYVARSGRLDVARDENAALVVRDGTAQYTVEASEDGGGSVDVSWTLAAAPVNSSLDTKLEAQWPNFRGNDENNSVTDVKIPTYAESGTLYWANKIGDGIDSGAVGSPIIVNNELITYAGNMIYRVDRVSGEILKEGSMVRKSSFAITPPSYADGMVFVALSNGTVQAFNAKTLESLWIYEDSLGGQPNCPLTIKDGYLYTGFWNSETGAANFVCMSITDEDPSDSDERKSASWYHTQKGGFYWAGAYAGDDFVVVGTDDGKNSCTDPTSRLLLFQPKTGALLDSWDGLNGDIRSTIVYDKVTNAYYFTSKGGSFYSFKVSQTADGWEISDTWEVALSNGHADSIPMSTCSPCVYNGRAYIGVSGAGQFSNYSGHNISVIDLASRKIVYRVNTQGYPQTSGLLTTAYSDYVYVYFFDNATPGKLRVLRDKAGQTSADYVTMEGNYTTAYALFTPVNPQAQYAICSPIVDEYGTIYFKNDSAHLMAFGSVIEKLEVTTPPNKLEYMEGECFDPTGMTVTATYANGKTRDVTDYISYSEEALTAEDTLFTIAYEYVMYHNVEDGTAMTAGVVTTTPTAVIELTFPAETPVVAWDVNGDGEVTKEDAQMILDYEAQILDEEFLEETADLSGDGVIDSNDAVLLLKYLSGEITIDEIEGLNNDENEE